MVDDSYLQTHKSSIHNIVKNSGTILERLEQYLKIVKLAQKAQKAGIPTEVRPDPYNLDDLFFASENQWYEGLRREVEKVSVYSPGNKISISTFNNRKIINSDKINTSPPAEKFPFPEFNEDPNHTDEINYGSPLSGLLREE